MRHTNHDVELGSLTCPKCGGPLSGRARRVVVVCGYCGASVSLAQKVVQARRFGRAQRRRDAAALAGGAVLVGAFPYRVLGRIAQGEVADVFLAERARRLSERVVLKRVRDLADEPFLAREVEVTRHLERSRSRGASHFRRLIPEPLFVGRLTQDGRELPAATFRYRAGFSFTLEDLRRAHPAGLDPRHAVWIWRRTLELLSWLHRAGVIHGAPVPEHLIVHPAEHAVLAVGFGRAVSVDNAGPLLAAGAAKRPFYPQSVLEGQPLETTTDLAVAARSIRHLLGDGTPRPLAALLETIATQVPERWPTTDAFALRELVGEVAEEVFGPPRFVELRMPPRGIAETGD